MLHDIKRRLRSTIRRADQSGAAALLGCERLEDRYCLSGFSLVPALGSPFPISALAVATGDFNLDGHMDVATTNQGAPLPPGPIETVGVLLGNGAGGFAPGALFPVGGSAPLALAVGDFNGDGKPDLATANAVSNNVSVLLGNGLGGFSSPATIIVGTQPSSIVVGDFNGDHVPDLATADKSSDNVSVLLGNGLGGFVPAIGSPFTVKVAPPPPPPPFPPPPPVSFAPASLVTDDFNGDGHADLAAANSGVGSVSILLGGGLGSFGPPSVIPVLGSSPISLAVANANGDAHIDLVAGYTGGGVSALLGDGSGGFTPLGAMPTFGLPVSLAVADFNDDGNVDAVTAASGANTVGVNLGNGAGAFAPFSAFTVAPVGASLRSLAVADFNGDHRPDVATANLGSASVLLNVPNQPPVATPDSYTIPEDNLLIVSAAAGVLANDTDADGDPFTAILVLPPPAALGLLQMQPDGSFSFAPSANFNGTASFTYLARDSKGANSLPAVVTFTVTPVNDPPFAASDSFETDANIPLVVAAPGVLANDFDVDFEPLAAVLTSGPANGSLNLSPDGSFNYTPNPGFSGMDSFTYRARDLSGTLSPSVAVTITVHGPPVAQDFVVSTKTDTPAFICLFCFVSDPDGFSDIDLTSFEITQAPAHGTVSLFGPPPIPGLPPPPPIFVYTPNLGYSGPDSLAYNVRDKSGAVSNEAVVTLSIIPNLPPVALNDSAATLIGQPVTIDVLSNDNDPDGIIDSQTLAIQQSPGHGSVSIDPFSRSISYTPDCDFVGSDSFTYTVRDNDGAESNVATVAIDVIAARLEFGFLTVFGTCRRDIVRVEPMGDTLVVHALLGMPSEGPMASSGNENSTATPRNPEELRLEFPLAGVQGIFASAGAGNDQFTIAPTITLPATLDGGEGDDWLRTGSGDDGVFDAFGDNRVETGDGSDLIAIGLLLPFGQSNNRIDAGAGDDFVFVGDGDDSIDAGPGNDLVRAGRGNDSIDGGFGNDILLGQEGDDSVVGGDGFDLLIGGLGADHIVGNQGDDILIAGTTAYDFNDFAVRAILAEWTSELGYSDRVANLSAGIGPLGVRLSGDAGPLQTVFEDNDVDVLSGNQARDWFFANLTPDNGGALDQVTDKAAGESWLDTDLPPFGLPPFGGV